MQHRSPFNLCLNTVRFVITRTIKDNPTSQLEMGIVFRRAEKILNEWPVEAVKNDSSKPLKTAPIAFFKYNAF
jgi:hypothetical protein